MRKLFVTEFVSLDGVMEDPGGAEKSPHGGWCFKNWSDSAGKYKFDELMGTGALLLGRKTYEGFAAAWPSMVDENGFADRMNGLPKYVVSSSLPEATWNNSNILREDFVAQIRQLKREEGQDMMVAGSGTLAKKLLAERLVDEIRLMIHPIVLGSGTKFFSEGSPYIDLEMISSEALGKGVIVVAYGVKSGSH